MSDAYSKFAVEYYESLIVIKKENTHESATRTLHALKICSIRMQMKTASGCNAPAPTAGIPGEPNRGTPEQGKGGGGVK